jgi:hypothetical protein
MDIGDDRGDVIPPRGRGFGCFGRVLSPESRDVGPDLSVIPKAPEEVAHPGARVAEQRFMDELDGCGRALDVQQDGADLGQRDAVRSGM